MCGCMAQVIHLTIYSLNENTFVGFAFSPQMLRCNGNHTNVVIQVSLLTKNMKMKCARGQWNVLNIAEPSEDDHFEIQNIHKLYVYCPTLRCGLLVQYKWQ